MKEKTPLKPLDLMVIALSAILTLVIGVVVYSGEFSDSRVIIRGPDKTWIYPLNADEKVTVTGSLGETVVEIRQGRAAIVYSPCSGQTCVAAGGLHKNGQWAACLPNRVFLLVEGMDGGSTGGGAIDAASW